MKPTRFMLIALLMTAGIFNLVSAQEKSTPEWKEKDDFHKVMASTFHPSEEGNFKPIRERATEMEKKAIAWKNSVPPKEMSSPEISKKLDELVKGAGEIALAVKKNADDKELSEKLSALHEVFHSIVGLCKPEHEHEHEHEKK